MTLTKQQHKLLEIMVELERDTTPNELEIIYKSKHKEIGGNSVYKQLDRLVVDGFVKRLSHGKYGLTNKCLAILNDKENTPQEHSIRFTEEEVKEFKEFSKLENCLDILAEMLNPALLGLQKERLAALVVLISAKDEYGDRNRVTLLLSGPPSVGKSQIIKWIYIFLWGFWIESDASQSGMKGTGKGYQFSEGILQKADNSVVLIDEIDKMNKKDQSSLLSAIETGTVKVNKDRVDRETPARVRIIATCNNKGMMVEQLLNRFDIILDVEKLSDDERNGLITKRTNDWNREKISSKGATFLKKYLIFANQISVQLPEDREWVNNYLLHELQYGVLQAKDPRQIEAIYRIAIAIGKLKLHTEVDLEDLKKAIYLLS